MSDIRLYVDEDAAETALMAALRREGIDVLTADQAATRGADDVVQLMFATEQRRTLYTLNSADFAALHARFLASGKSHAGIITIPEQRYGIGEKRRRLLAFLSSTSAEEMVDQIAYL